MTFFSDLKHKKSGRCSTAFITNAMDRITYAVQEAGMTIDTSVPLPDSL